MTIKTFSLPKAHIRSLPDLLVVSLLVSLLAGCGKPSPIPEAPLVPGSVLFHVRLEPPFPDALTSFTDRGVLDRTLMKNLFSGGPLGLALLGVDVSSLEPQFLLLSREIGPEELVERIAENSGCQIRELPTRTDLILDGAPAGSVASRNGWTALYLGHAPEAIIPRWLKMDVESSLAADPGLLEMADRRASVTLFMPEEMIRFISELPGRRWVRWWDDLERVLLLLQPTGIVLQADQEPYLALEARIRKKNGEVTRMRLELEDESLETMALGFFEMVSRGGGILQVSLSIAARGIGRSFQDRPILQGVDLEVKEGEFVAVVGKSGAGKTTLLSILGVQDLGFTGELIVGGVQVGSATAAELRRLRRERIGFVFQDFHLLPELTPLENVLLPAVFAGGDAEAASASAGQVLHHLGLGLEDESTGVLSRGERQRVAVARAIVNRPSILLADEPTASLDEESEAVLFDLLHQLRKEIGFALVAVVHSDRALRSADRVLRLAEGRLQAI